MTAGGALDAEDVRARVQVVLDEVLTAQSAVLDEVSPDCAPLVGSVARLVAGGKRLRPAFCYWGWRGAGGAGDGDPVVRAAAALELFQAAALIHDDVMDASDVRRGMPAAHRQFSALHRSSGWAGDADRFGTAGAILTGDLCLSWSDEVLSDAGLGTEPLRRARAVFNRMRTQLMGGQYLDMLAQSTPMPVGARALVGSGPAAPPPSASPSGSSAGSPSGSPAGWGSAEEEVERARRVICFKSAKYTVEHPLLLGAAVAGAPPDVVAAYSAYGLPLGEAFQLRDDVLGVFGDPVETGKPAGDDLREGKRTVLVALALQRASPAQASVLRDLLGDPGLDADGIGRLREVVVDTGALERVETMIDDGVRRSREALAQAPVDDGARAVLDGLVEASTVRAA